MKAPGACLLCGLLLVGVLGGCDWAPQPVAFRHLEDPKADCVENPGPGAFLFRTGDELASFWEPRVRCLDARGAKVAPPTVDFSREAVIALFLDDQRFSGCAGLGYLVMAIEREGKVVRVFYREPVGGDLGPCRAIVQPRDFVGVDRAALASADDVVAMPYGSGR